MAHLIRTLKGERELNRLESAYMVLADAYLAHRSRQGNLAASGRSTFESLRDRVLASESLIQVGALCKPSCDLIDTDEERPVELFNNLGQIEVLVAAIKIMRQSQRNPTKSAPTQQSKDADGAAVADLEGDGWKLEAFGGHNCKNNKKLFEDLCTLKTSSKVGDELFVAFRRSAWTAAYTKIRLAKGLRIEVRGTTKRARPDFGNLKVNAQAFLELHGEADGIYVCKVFDLSCTPAVKPQDEFG